MKASRHLLMIAILLFALSLLFGHAGYIHAAQTTRTVLGVGVILWIAFLAICYDQQHLNHAKQVTCEILFAEQQRKLDDAVELISLSRARYRQPLFVPMEYQLVFQTLISTLEDTRRLGDTLSLAILRAHHLKIAHDMLSRQDCHIQKLYLSERHREYTLFPHRILLRLIRMRKEIVLFDARFLIPELKKIYVFLRKRHNPLLLMEEYGEQWELHFVSEVEKIYCTIEATLHAHKAPQLYRPK